MLGGTSAGSSNARDRSPVLRGLGPPELFVPKTPASGISGGTSTSICGRGHGVVKSLAENGKWALVISLAQLLTADEKPAQRGRTLAES